MRYYNPFFIVFIICVVGCFSCEKSGQSSYRNPSKAVIYEETQILKTYPFSDPNPIPNIGSIYPYFKFDGYTNHAIDQSWKMVVMENEYLKVFVSPEIGGKIWGAIEKSTGKEFLYKNEVVKFRNIAMRGPWTSGGLEFNFGDIGHAPSCSTPVDYSLKKNTDGSVSCIVGAYDLPSRTRWNVKITLPKDKAFLETTVSWFNLTDEYTSYYHWMNAAAKASGNLEFFYPGKDFIGHGGEPSSWPISSGRDLSKYENNDFGGYKSYHVVNAYADFFGGYWKEDDFGFGHHTDYDVKPGKKLWIWGLSQQGMIWEDLLTDNDGQYVEYQSGKLFNQAAEQSTYSPFKHRSFGPHVADVMKEIWFPLKSTKGMVAASKYAVLNVEEERDSVHIYLSALQHLKDTIYMQIGNKKINYSVDLSPLEITKWTLAKPEDAFFKIKLGTDLLNYKAPLNDLSVDRPLTAPSDFNWESAYGLYIKGLELERQRQYSLAMKSYHQSVQKNATFMPALSRLSLGYFRQMDFTNALKYSQIGLSIDTYDPECNYAFGLANRALGNYNEAKSGFSIAAQSSQLASAAYIALAKLFLNEDNMTKALHFASKALIYNRQNIVAHMIISYSNRQLKDKSAALAALAEVYVLDPLSDFARYEEYLWNNKPVSYFNKAITNELPHESYLELASVYYHFNNPTTAILVLKEGPENPIINVWLAYLEIDHRQSYINKIRESSVEMTFPYRVETAQFLETLSKEDASWKLKYYLGLIYWHKGEIDRAKNLFDQCQNEPNLATFYLTKHALLQEAGIIEKENLQIAQAMNPEDWRAGIALIDYHLLNNESSKALALSEKLKDFYPENAQIGLRHAQALLKAEKHHEALIFLEQFNLLPFEGSTEGKNIYSTICIQLALKSFKKKDYQAATTYAKKAKLWPQNLGVGKPYRTDDRLADLIIARAYEVQGDLSYYTYITNYKSYKDSESENFYAQLVALKHLGKYQRILSLIDQKTKLDPNNEYLNWAIAKYKDDPRHFSWEKRLIQKESKERNNNLNQLLNTVHTLFKM